MGKTYFTTTKDIKNNTLLDNNLNDKVLLVMFNEAQNRHLQQVLGTATYKDLLSKIDSNTINTIERTLIEDYILDYIYTTVELISTIDLISKFSNNGTTRDNPNYTISTTLEELKVIRVSHSGNVTFNGGLIKDFILDNIESFPLFDTDDGFITPKTVYNYGFVVYDEDFIEDAQLNSRSATNNLEEGI